MDKNALSDEQLALLHRQKKLNAFLIIYNRYKFYGHSIVTRTLLKTPYYNALKDDKDAIICDAIYKALSDYKRDKGSFRNLLSLAIERNTFKYVRQFCKNPLADYISIDANDEDSYYNLIDTLTFADSRPLPNEQLNINEKGRIIDFDCNGINRRVVASMIRLRELGYSFNEIARYYHTNAAAVRALFYQVRKQLNRKLSRKPFKK